MLELICKELGVEVGKVWIGNDGKDYSISKTGQIIKIDDAGTISYYNGWEKIVMGKLKPVWKPRMGERYWTVEFGESSNAAEYAWANTYKGKQSLAKDLVFKTKEEAIETANKMLEVLKHD